MSNVNEPEGALELAATMVRDQVHMGRTMQTQMGQMAEVLGRMVALAEMLDEAGNGEVVLVDPADSSTTPVAEELEGIRSLLLTHRELDASIGEQLEAAQMMYDRFLERYVKGEEDA
jgi:hypothetical protein